MHTYGSWHLTVDEHIMKEQSSVQVRPVAWHNHDPNEVGMEFYVAAYTYRRVRMQVAWNIRVGCKQWYVSAHTCTYAKELSLSPT